MSHERTVTMDRAHQARANMEACKVRIKGLQEQIALEKKSLKYWGIQMTQWSAEAGRVD